MPERLHYCLHGDPASAPALMLIHPLGAALDFWDDCLPAWTPAYSVLALDLRSAGHSPRGLAPGLDQHVADLEFLRAALGLDTVVPVACAVGGMVAAAYAAHYPDRVTALVLANPTPRSAEPARAMLTARAEAVRQDGMAAILPGAVERPFERQPRDARYARYLAAFAAQDPGAYAEAVLGFATADASADLARVRCPTLLVAGRHDLLLPIDHAAATRALLPSGTRLEIDEEGAHFLPYQRPAAFAARVLAFLGQAAGRPGPVRQDG